MKKRFTLFTFLLLCFTGLNAQTGYFNGQGVPLKPQSPLFGKDIVIQDISDRDQRNIAICSAFNGWLYAAYSYSQPDQGYISVLRSVDNGINWNFIGGGGATIFGNKIITNLGIIACGNSLSNIKLFIGWVFNDTVLNFWGAYVGRYNPDPFIVEGEILNETGGIKDLALSNDYNYPALNSNPFSIAVLYSKSGVKDSIIFRSSSNGGLSLDNRLSIATTWNYFHKVSLNYGRSPSWNSGRYFAAWEEQTDQYSNLGHIYTAHSDPNFNSPFTTPIQLDALSPSTLNMCRNPNIACQYNNVDNDSANLTEVVLFEKYKPASADYDVTGFYNLQATTTSHFRPLNIAATSNNELQPDINFNPYSSAFMMTYFDATEKKLPFLTNDVNLTSPNSWNVVSQGYNDNSNLVAPNPKVELNFAQQDGMNAWIEEGTGGNGIALFDAPYSTYTGVSGHSTGTSAKLIGSYPNPCSNSINIAFELKNAGRVTINLLGIMGQPFGTVTNQTYSAGKHVVKYDVSDLPNGNYLYNIRSGDFNAIGKFTVIR